MCSDLKFLFPRVQFKTRKHYQTKINIPSTMKQLTECVEYCTLKVLIGDKLCYYEDIQIFFPSHWKHD